MAVVRLDPFQNIVNVGWGPDGPPDNLPPPGPLIAPQLWDWQFKSTASGFDRNDITMEPNADTGGFFENPVDGDLLLAHISCDRATDHGDPWPQIAVSGPGMGWQQLWQFSTEQAGSPSPGFDQTGSLWFKYFHDGDPDEYTWTYSQTCPVTGGIFRVIDPWPDAVPFPDAQATDVKEQTTGIATGPNFTISRDHVLLLAFIDANSNFNTAGIFPSNPTGSGSYTRRTFNRSFGTANGHAQIIYDADDEPGPGAIGARSLSVSTSFNTIVGHLAILGNPAP